MHTFSGRNHPEGPVVMTEAALRNRVANEAQQYAFAAAQPYAAHENIRQRIDRAAANLGRYGVPAWRVEEAWKGRATSWAAWAFEQLRDAHAQWTAETDRKKAAARELDTARLGALHARLSAEDAGFHDETLRAVRRVLAQRDRGRS